MRNYDHLGDPPVLSAPDTSQVHTQSRRYELITPLFGGGVTPGKQDPVTPVRGTIIRGQLRFWWRATRAGHYTSIEELRRAESLLWGAASTATDARPSLVQIAVTDADPGREFIVTDNRGHPATDNRGDPIAVGHFRSPFSYVAFPLQQLRGTVQDGIAFTLTITVPTAWPEGKVRSDGDAATATQARPLPSFAGTPAEEIAAALWAWETFGGIGGRTRRGFGALRCLTIDGKAAGSPTSNDVQNWLAEQLTRHIVDGAGPEQLPSLHRDMRWYRVVAGNQDSASSWKDPIDAWKYLFSRLKDFRQPRPPGSNDPRRPGRSRWPEPEAIRNMTGERERNHQPMPTSGKFPRAAFGLPIIFQFKDHGDPQQTSLQGQSEFDRLASPLILRPLQTSDGRAFGLAMVLDAPRIPPGGLALYRGKTMIGTPDASLNPDEASAIKDRSGKNPLLSGLTDVLEAFLNFL
jgi:CRISPR-associated protein Cmr1